jgi:hypothetical protein
VSHYSAFPIKSLYALYQNPCQNQEVAVWCDVNIRKIKAPYYTDMRRLTTGISSEKCVTGRFRRHANVKECTYTNPDSIAYYTPSLYTAYCSLATNLYSVLLY